MWCRALTRIPSYYQLNIFQLEMPPCLCPSADDAEELKGENRGRGHRRKPVDRPPPLSLEPITPLGAQRWGDFSLLSVPL